jgi:two-component system, NarL family, nitrate/nitrite response regulator NarL
MTGEEETTAGESNAIRVMIADDQPIFRQTLRTFLEPERDVTIAGEASDSHCVLALVRQLKPDVLLIDAALFYDLKYREETVLAVKTLMTVATLDRIDVIKPFLQGAKAIVSKPSPPSVWPESIRTVAAGHYWLGNESVGILVQALRAHFFQETARSPKDYRLTAREVQIMDKIADGHSNKEVGQAFSICERTVKHHLTNIFTKVGVSSRLELGLFAINHRLVEAGANLRRPMSLDGHWSAKSEQSTD